MNEEMLHAYLDDELTPAERAHVENALATDASVAAQLEQLRAVHESLDLLESMDSSFEGATLLRRERRRRIGRLLRLATPLAAAAAALLLVLMPRETPDATSEAVFSVEEQVRYVYWETDETAIVLYYCEPEPAAVRVTTTNDTLRFNGMCEDRSVRYTVPGPMPQVEDHVFDDVPRIFEFLARISTSEYHEGSALDARRRIVGFFDAHLKPPSPAAS